MAAEPVRGHRPDPSLFSLSGLELLRAYMRGHVVGTPLFRLLGPRVTQASSGTAVVHQLVSPWFEVNDEFVDLMPTAEYIVFVTATTGALPATFVRAVNVSLRYLRPCTVADEMLIARGRILHAGSSFTTVEALIEDSLGRSVAHAMGSVVMTPMEPAPPPPTRELGPVDEPTYATPDPPRRTVPQEARASGPGQRHGRLPPFGQLVGAEILSTGDGRAEVVMPPSEWFCRLYPEVSPGIVGLLGNIAIQQSIFSIAEPEQRLAILHATLDMMKPVEPTARSLRASGRIRVRRGDVLVAEAEIVDEDDTTVAIVHGSVLLRADQKAPKRSTSERVLLTVVFTDIVGSTEQARELGDERWNELLGDHFAVLRRQLELHRGREIKTTGDGLLATFDSPTRAVQFAVAARRALDELALHVRVGIHTGECEQTRGDVAGLAVHVASRLQSVAETDEILVSSTVRDLSGGSSFLFHDRGERRLKGLDGQWPVFSVEPQ